jgi:hypothetical protein
VLFRKPAIEARSRTPNPMTNSLKAFDLVDRQYEEIVRLRPWTATDIYEMKGLAKKALETSHPGVSLQSHN